MATIKHLVRTLLLTTLLICTKVHWYDKKNNVKWKRMHPIVAPKLGFSAMHLLKIPMESWTSLLIISYSIWQLATGYIDEICLSKFFDNTISNSLAHVTLTMSLKLVLNIFSMFLVFHTSHTSLVLQGTVFALNCSA